MINCFDRKSAKLESKNTESTLRQSRGKMIRVHLKVEWKHEWYLILLTTWTHLLNEVKKNKLMKFLWDRIEGFIDYLLAGKEPITVSSSFNKSIV